MSSFLREICAPQIKAVNANSINKFSNSFADLYRIELFKDGLDLILTKLQEGHLSFEITIMKDWDTNVGCFLTEQKSFYDKTLGKFLRKSAPKIILRQMTHNVLAHEMAHALEFESGVDLGQEFRQAVGFDMKNRQPQLFTLKGEIKRLMVDALKSYPQNQFISELFARYFELLSISRNVCAHGDFTTSDVMDFYENTTNFVTKIFNPQIRSKIDPNIARETLKIAEEVKLVAPQQKFQEKVESLHAGAASGQRSWVKNTKSNAMWQAGWEKHQQLEDKK